jgi:hypothetical protein
MKIELNLKNRLAYIWLVLLIGCGQSKEAPDQGQAVQSAKPLELVFPDAFDPDNKALITENWPRVWQACKGLGKYGKELVFEGVQENLYLGRVAVVVKVPSENKTIPQEFMANGHLCFFSISRDAKSVFIAKDVCKSICKGRHIRTPVGSDDLEIELPDTSGSPE